MWKAGVGWILFGVGYAEAASAFEGTRGGAVGGVGFVDELAGHVPNNGCQYNHCKAARVILRWWADCM